MLFLKHILLAAFVLGLASAANGATLEESIDGLAAKGSADKIAAIDALAASDDGRARDILQAMLDGRLYRVKADDRIVFADKVDGGFDIVDALTGEDLGEVGKRDVKKIKANNRLRGKLRGIIGGMSLLSKDAEVRQAAADAIFKTPTAAIVPMLEQAVADEADEDVRDRLERALAAARIATSDSSEIRQAAVRRLAAFTDVDVRAFVGALVIETADGFAEPDAAVRAAAGEALEEIDASIARWTLVGNLFQGLSLGSVLLLAAIGLAITFGVMGVINMAHGEMVMLGAYTTFVVQEVFREHFPASFDYSLAVAIPAAFIIVGALGIAIERGIIRFLYGRPLETLLATWGLSLILQQSVRTIFGPTNREVGNPSWMTGAIDVAGSVSFTYNRLWIIVFSLIVFAGLMALLARTSLGLRMRAVTQNRAMASSMGIRTGAVDALTFGLGCGIAGIAGVALSQIDNVGPNLGRGYIVDSFMVVVFGGVGNLWGTLVGATTLGVVNKFLEPYAGAVLGKILVLVAIILFIQKRPRGMFALKGRAVEN